MKLRPHYKSHKCAEIAHEQIENGAIGMTCAKLDEAIDLCDSGIEDILIANQIEGVFGVLKEDYGFRRFLTRGKKNIETHFFLLAFALNIEKLCNRTKKGRIGLDLFALNAS